MTRTQPLKPEFSGLHSEELFRHLVNAVTDYAIFVLDPQGHIASWNPGAERIKGYKPDEIIGKHFSIFYEEEEKRAGKPDFELRVAAREGRFEDEGWRVRKDGTLFWANVVITAIHDDNGRLLGFGKITRDLTERRAAEERYRLLVEGVTDYAIFTLDPTGVITSWNPGAERIKGYTPDEIIGQHFSRFYTPEDVEAGLPATVLQSALQSGHWEGEGWRVRKDGLRFWSSVVVTPLWDARGELYGFSKITRDISDRQQLLEQIKQHADELEVRVRDREQTNAELEAFSYSVSHDLRAPLRIIEGFATALEEDAGDKLDETARGYLKEINGAAVRMSRLVQDLLEYSRVSRTELALGPVPVGEAVENAVKQLGEPATGLKVSVPAKLWVMAHRNTLVQVIFNLVSNALKFHPPGVHPQVQVGCEARPNGFVRLSVTDEGIGIAPQHHERIFQVFERLHGPDGYPGTGIGLAIVKRGIERMRGRYGLISEPGKGSTFWIELPAAKG